MPRLATFLIAAVLAVGFGGVQLAQSQAEPAPPAGQTAPAVKGKKGMTAEEKAKLKEERVAKRKGMTPEEKAKLKEERASKKAAKAATKAKREECRTKGKQDNLKGKKFREFMQTCAGA